MCPLAMNIKWQRVSCITVEFENVWYLKNKSCPNRFQRHAFSILYIQIFFCCFQSHSKYSDCICVIVSFKNINKIHDVIRLESSYIMSQNNNVITIFIFHCLHIILHVRCSLCSRTLMLCIFMTFLKYIPILTSLL